VFKFAISAGFEKMRSDSFRKALAPHSIPLFQKMRGWLSLKRPIQSQRIDAKKIDRKRRVAFWVHCRSISLDWLAGAWAKWVITAVVTKSKSQRNAAVIQTRISGRAITQTSSGLK
jgi:hypothetical protein